MIDCRLEKLYNSLVTKHKINSANNDLWTPENYGFSYRDPRNNFAKLFMQAHMAKFSQITESSFNGSAALNVLQ